MNTRLSASSAWRWLVIVCAVILPFLWVAASRASDAATQAEYLRRFHDLAAKDLDGHLALGEWCREQEAYDLLRRQCNHILSFAPDHKQARLYLQLAQAKLAEAGGSTSATEAATGTGQAAATAPQPDPASRGKLRVLTDEEVQRLKRSELLMGQERLVVKFHDDVRARFWNYMAAREGLGRGDWVRYNKLKPSVLAQSMLAKIEDYKRAATDDSPFFDEFGPLIEITNDPAVFRAFERNIWPIVQDGCASAKCHGGPDAQAYQLLNERSMSDNAHYTNFFVLSEWADGDRRLIDRDRPTESLLLQFGFEHPATGSTGHPVNIEPMFRSANDRRLQKVGAWISALNVPKPDYELTLDDLRK